MNLKLFIFILIFILFFSLVEAEEAREHTPDGKNSSITIKDIKLNVSTHTLTVLLGNETSFIAYVKNVGIETVNVKISIENSPGWATVIPSSANIEPNKTQEYLVTIKVPKNTRTDIYELKVVAVDLVKSGEEDITLIVGRDYEEICNLLLQEIRRVKTEVNVSLSIGECMDISMLEALFSDGEIALNNGESLYRDGSYEKAIDWFEYALSTYKKVLGEAENLINVELEILNKSELFPPFFDVEKQFNLAGNYLEEKNYEEICEPIEEIRKYILFGIMFYVGTPLIILIILIVAVFFWKKKREEEREKMIERIRERLREFSSTISTS